MFTSRAATRAASLAFQIAEGKRGTAVPEYKTPRVARAQLGHAITAG
jgi:hypothetical protein